MGWIERTPLGRKFRAASQLSPARLAVIFNRRIANAPDRSDRQAILCAITHNSHVIRGQAGGPLDYTCQPLYDRA